MIGTHGQHQWLNRNLRFVRYLAFVCDRGSDVTLLAKHLIEWDLLMCTRAITGALALSLALAAIAPSAFADGAIVGLMSDEDREVLAEFDQRRAAAITVATAGPETVAVTTLTQVLEGQPLSFDDGYDPSAEWRCRYLKLGGDQPLKIH